MSVGGGDPPFSFVFLGREGVAGIKPCDFLVAPKVIDSEIGVGVECEGDAEL